jgi:hypothetical protein
MGCPHVSPILRDVGSTDSWDLEIPRSRNFGETWGTPFFYFPTMRKRFRPSILRRCSLPPSPGGTSPALPV